ncbi:MAG: type II toxin-antitoxin system VapC family toxin [Acidobacteria bacterium]|nr:type II toxin-antitoxin system VapC family toxin [Acidobacteriota bacterium]
MRDVVIRSRFIYSSELALVEMATVFHRHLREGHASLESIDAAQRLFQLDQQRQFWVITPVSTEIVTLAARIISGLPSHLLIRASDAIHLATARHLGLTEVWTNDRRMLEAAPAFGVTGRSV